ncbi:MAG: RHS repeat-associated protein [Halioglobus sp.]
MKKINQFLTIAVLILAIVSQTCILSGQEISYEDLYTQETYEAQSINTGLSVGAIGGSADVSNGTSSYMIPIQIPAGTNNVSPDISLVYNSQGGDGHVGYGWNISGISTISRGLNTLYHDGKSQAVKLSSEDKFIIDGTRMIKSTPTMFVKENHDYGTIEMMGSMGSGPLWFRMETKYGVVMEVGKENNSTLLSEDGNEIIFWKVSKIIYQDGNYMEYEYNSSARDHRISEIRYTGNSVSGISPYNRVIFNYKDRGVTKNKTYEAGSTINLNNLLDNIEVKTEGDLLVKRYELSYGSDDINAYLKKVTEEGSDGSELNPTILKYGDYTDEFSYDFVGFHPVATKEIYTGDFNGDGYSDKLIANKVEEDGETYHDSYIIETKAPSPTNNDFFYKFTQTLNGQARLGDEKGQYNFYSGDFTGEGRDDIVYAFSTEVNSDKFRLIGNIELHKMEPNANGVITEDIGFPANAKQFFDHEDKSLNIGDFNGDGVMDMIVILCDFTFDLSGSISLENHEAYIYYGSLSTVFEKVTLTGTSTLDIEDWNVRNINTIDIDGDGKNELMVTNGLYSEIYTFEDTTVTSVNGSALGYPTQYHLMFFGDFNGDRKTDVLTRTDLNNNGAPWTVGRGTGSSFIEDAENFQWLGLQPEIDENYVGELLLIGDYNGDGKSDIARGANYLNDQQIQFYFSRGNNWYYDPYNIDENAENNTFGVQDFNGDGKSDLMNRKPDASGTTRVLKYKPRGQEMLLTNIKNGHGHETTYTYKNMTELGSEYTRTSFSDHPINTIRVPMQLPTRLKKEGYATIRYEYTNAKLHKEGKGLLGFEKIETRTLDGTGMKEETNFILNNDHSILLPETSIRKKLETVLSTRTIEHTITTHTAIESGIDYFTHHVTGSTDINDFEGTQTSTSTTYDEHGNAIISNIDINGVEGRSTITAFGQFSTPVPSTPITVANFISRSGSTSFQKYETLTHNSIGQLMSHVINPGDPKSTTTSYTYDQNGNVNTTTISAANEVDRTSSNVFDTKGRYIESATNTLGQISSATYSPVWGKPMTTTGLDGLTTSYQYDFFGRLLHTTAPQGYIIDEEYEWDIGSNIYIHKTIKPGDTETSVYYDKLDRIIKNTEKGYGQLKISTVEFDDRGLKTLEVLPSGFSTSYIFDDYNRPTLITNDYGSSSMTYGYSNGELQINVTNAAGQVSSSKKDATGKIVGSTDYGGTQSYTYHSNGNLATVTKSGTQLVSTSYDAFGHQTGLIDVNAGVLTYQYNAWGELVNETNAKGQETVITYNNLGQIESKVGPEGTTTFTYKSTGPAINQLYTITGFDGDSEVYSYDQFGRMAGKTHTIDGIANSFTYNYDNQNHVTSKTFPSGLSLNYTYNSEGYLETIKDGTNSQTIFENISMSTMDLNTKYKSIINGNTQIIDVEYDNVTPTYIENGNKTVHDYSWDFSSGNLMHRTTDYTGVSFETEVFTYDNLNRLKSQAIGSNPAINTNYSANGNISDRTNVGTLYNYDATRVNAVSGIVGADYANLSMYNQYIKYTSFDQPEVITEHGNELTLNYNSQMQRMKSMLTLNNGDVSTRYYLGDYERLVENGVDKHLHYVNVGRGIHMIIKRENGSDAYYRTMTDNQGSIVYIGDTNGNEEFYNYDAWGRRRNPANYTYVVPSTNFSWMNRGYTGHEHLDDFQLINMNGRLYDPVIARMLSPDNNIQLPFNTQNYNRYSYALNNPLRFTDPNGELVVSATIAVIIKGVAIAVAANGISNTIQNQPFFNGAGKAAVFGAIGGALSSGIGEVASYAFNKLGASKLSVAIFQAVGHSWTGAVFAMAQGDSPLSGFVGGAASSIVSSGIGNLGLGYATTLISGGFTGGIGAKLAGGDFWQGVGRGLITTGLNHLAHSLTKPDDFIYLLDREGVGNTGVGHTAILIQGEGGKWFFISKAGKGTIYSDDVQHGERSYDSPEDFYKSEDGQRYESRIRIAMEPTKSLQVYKWVKSKASFKYNFLSSNCDDMCKIVLDEAGINYVRSRVPIITWNSVRQSQLNLKFRMNMTELKYQNWQF